LHSATHSPFLFLGHTNGGTMHAFGSAFFSFLISSFVSSLKFGKIQVDTSIPPPSDSIDIKTKLTYNRIPNFINNSPYMSVDKQRASEHVSAHPNEILSKVGRFRHLLYATLMAVALSVGACGPDGNGGNEDTSSDTGTDDNDSDTETGGDADTDTDSDTETETDTDFDTGTGTDECYLVGDGCDDLYICDGILTQDVAVGETGEWEAPIDGLNAGATFRLRIGKPDVIVNPNTVAFVRHAVSGTVFIPGANETQLASFDGISATLINRDDPFNADCSIKGAELGDEVEMDLTDVYGGVYHEDDGLLEEADSTVDAEGTKIRTGSFSNFFIVDTPPETPAVSPRAIQRLNGKIQVVTDQFTDEGVPLPPSLATMEIAGEPLEQIGDTNVWETLNPVTTGATASLRVLGANGTVQGHADDEVVLDIPVEVETEDHCADVNYDDGDACNGVETCDPIDGSEIPGLPIDHDDGNTCNGEESCDPTDGSMISGTPIDYDDGLSCNGAETCNPSDGSEIPGTDVNCGDHGACEEPAGTCNCSDGFSGDNCEISPPAPEISGLVLDCSGGLAPGYCLAGEYDYPVTFNVTGANSCTATAEMILGTTGTDGLVTDVNLVGENADLTYTTGTQGGSTIRITADCDGLGGSDSEYIDYELW